jgi:hypothetical protein
VTDDMTSTWSERTRVSTGTGVCSAQSILIDDAFSVRFSLCLWTRHLRAELLLLKHVLLNGLADQERAIRQDLASLLFSFHIFHTFLSYICVVLIMACLYIAFMWTEH